MGKLPETIVPVLAGGGTRLPAHVGILQGLADLGIGYRSLVGVSGGSIVAALAASGWAISDILSLALEIDFSRFLGHSIPRLVRQGGLSSGDEFEHWLDKCLEGQTFEELSGDLHIVATDICSQGPAIFDRQRTPKINVASAVRCSMGIPLIFACKVFDEKWLVDGSILAEDALRQDWAQGQSPVILFRLRASQSSCHPPKRSFFILPQYLVLLVRTFLTTISREYVKDLYWLQTLVVETGDISPLEFDLNFQQKKDLYHLGHETVLHFLPRKLGCLSDLRH